MALTLNYFAALRDRMGTAEETIEADAATPRALVEWLIRRDEHAEPLGHGSVRFIVNDMIATADTPLRDGDRIAFCPPFSGG